MRHKVARGFSIQPSPGKAISLCKTTWGTRLLLLCNIFFFTGQLLPTFGPAGDHVAQVGHMVRGERLGNGGAGALPQPDLVEHVLKGLLLLLDGFAGHFVEHRQRQQRFAGFCFAFRCSFGRG